MANGWRSWRAPTGNQEQEKQEQEKQEGKTGRRRVQAVDTKGTQRWSGHHLVHRALDGLPIARERERESKKRNQIKAKVGRHLLPRPIDGVAKQQAATQKASCETKTREGNMQDKDGTRGSI